MSSSQEMEQPNCAGNNEEAAAAQQPHGAVQQGQPATANNGDDDQQRIHVATVISPGAAASVPAVSGAAPVDESQLPPTRRHLIYGAISLIAFILFIAAIFEPFVMPKSCSGSYGSSLWKTCTVVQNCDLKTGTACGDPLDSVLCDKGKNVIKALRGFLILSIAMSLIGASVAASSFLGAEVIAQNFKLCAVLCAAITTVAGLISVALAAGFFHQEICTGSPILAEDGVSEIKAMVPLAVVGAVLELSAVIVMFLPMECLDVFHEWRDWCDK